MTQGPILVVEDVPNVLELLEVTLRFKGYQVISARNGLEGLEKAQTGNPAMIITDILMPKLDGFAFVQKLREDPKTRGIPVVFLSATYVTPEDRGFAMSLGAARFIEKPIDTEEFLLTVAEIMTQGPPTSPEPLNSLAFYQGYRERLEQKLRHKHTQIQRIERLIPTLPEEQRPAFKTMFETSVADRENIRAELQEIYRILEEMKGSKK
ncbi:MAG: response regulator [Anaerolineae bacterium]|nr:response regulator [Anaerolineae bacterium]